MKIITLCLLFLLNSLLLNCRTLSKTRGMSGISVLVTLADQTNTWGKKPASISTTYMDNISNKGLPLSANLWQSANHNGANATQIADGIAPKQNYIDPVTKYSDNWYYMPFRNMHSVTYSTSADNKKLVSFKISTNGPNYVVSVLYTSANKIKKQIENINTRRQTRIAQITAAVQEMNSDAGTYRSQKVLADTSEADSTAIDDKISLLHNQNNQYNYELSQLVEKTVEIRAKEAVAAAKLEATKNEIKELKAQIAKLKALIEADDEMIKGLQTQDNKLLNTAADSQTNAEKNLNTYKAAYAKTKVASPLETNLMQVIGNCPTPKTPDNYHGLCEACPIEKIIPVDEIGNDEEKAEDGAKEIPSEDKTIIENGGSNGYQTIINDKTKNNANLAGSNGVSTNPATKKNKKKKLRKF